MGSGCSLNKLVAVLGRWQSMPQCTLSWVGIAAKSGARQVPASAYLYPGYNLGGCGDAPQHLRAVTLPCPLHHSLTHSFTDC